MKKIITLALSIVLILTLMAGCGEDTRLLYNVDLKDYIKVGTYKGIEIDTNSKEYKETYNSLISSDVSGADVTEELKKGTVQKGDVANIDYVGKKDGVAFEGGTAEGYDLEIGSNSFIEGFEDGLIGVEIGATVDLNLKFPENYGKDDLNGAAVVFTVTVNSVKRKVDLYDTIGEGKVENGDVANIDYVGKKDGVAFEGGTANGYDLTIGSNSFIDGFEEGLIGVEVGSTVDLDLTFPENYGNEALKGAKVVFTVKVNSIKRPKAPKDTYRDLGFKTLKVYEMDLKKRAVTSMIMDKLAKDAKVIKYSDEDIEFLYNAEKKQAENYYTSYYGMDFASVLAQSGMTEAQYKENSIKNSIKPQSKEQMIFYYIFDKEEMSFTADETNAKINEIVKANEGATVEKVKEVYGEHYFEYEVIREKVTELLYKSAKIK